MKRKIAFLIASAVLISGFVVMKVMQLLKVEDNQPVKIPETKSIQVEKVIYSEYLAN